MGDKGQQEEQKMKDSKENLLEEVTRQFGTLNAEKRKLADKEQHLAEREKRLAEIERLHKEKLEEYEDELETAGLLLEEEKCQIAKNDQSLA